LPRLGAGESIEAVCQAAGLSRAEFDAWWRRETAARVPPASGQARASTRRPVEVLRDCWGVPHVLAHDEHDLFVGYGYAQAQDRLFQLDYLRRKGAGRLAEVLGPEALEYDLLVRTVGLRRIAEAEWSRLPDETQRVLVAFTAGVNAVIEQSADRVPIEFDLLDYRPEPWSPLDCLTIEVEFRWYLTGRFPVIVMPELARKALGEGPLFRAFLTRESDDESIVPPGSYQPAVHLVAGTLRVPSGVGCAAGDPDAATGSNNWVVNGQRSASGRPMVASDPHIAFEAVSCWHLVQLSGGAYRAAGAGYVGMPAVLFGRTEHVAWGCTNNICSLRDLYQEKTDPAHPNCYLAPDGRWLPERRHDETIRVRGREPVTRTIRHSHNGPIVDDVLPPPARGTGPVALRWLGAEEGGWLTALLGMNRARTAVEFRAALRPWHVPTFSVVFADDGGHVGFQSTGRIPVRRLPERGYRPGWDPQHQWDGLIPFEGMPRSEDPERGWLATANHRPAPDDFPYPLSGTWGDDYRARRIRTLIEARPTLSRLDFGRMHQDARSVKAADRLPALLEALSGCDEPRAAAAVELLRSWDGNLDTDSAAAAIFEVFLARWAAAVALARFDRPTAELLSGGINGLASALLADDPAGWFPAGERLRAIQATFHAALDELADRFGPDVSVWTWGRLHTLPLRHFLGGRGDLGQLLDRGGQPVRGGLTTVCNVSPMPNYVAAARPSWEGKIGAGFRMIADLATQPPEMWCVDAGSQSGHVGSPHYADRLDDWLEGRYQSIALGPTEARRAAVERFVLEA
jgi:penicillin amidase